MFFFGYLGDWDENGAPFLANGKNYDVQRIETQPHTHIHERPKERERVTVATFVGWSFFCTV